MTSAMDMRITSPVSRVAEPVRSGGCGVLGGQCQFRDAVRGGDLGIGLGRDALRLAKGQDTILLAAQAGRPLTFSYFGSSPTRPGWAEIFGFYNHPDGWGSGSAAALMVASLRRLREDGFGGVHLWTLRDTPQSRRCYTKSGFTESGAVRGHDFGDGNPIEQVEYEFIAR